MALYTVCATTRGKPARACAVVQAVSDAAAAATAERLHADGSLSFLPEDARITVRPASRREVNAYMRFMPVKPVKGPAGRDIEISHRAGRARTAFYEKLWRGEIDDRKTG